MIDVLALGELLIDFTHYGESETGMRLFEQNPGGAPANVLSALSRLGRSTAFIGKVGQDMHGEFLYAALSREGIDLTGLMKTDEAFTTLAFVELSHGERRFSFARKPGADTCLRPEDVKRELIESAKVFHFGSLSLTHEPARTATLHAVRTAKHNGSIISYDPNYRAVLWSSQKQAVQQMRSVLEYIDMIKISDEETALLTDREDPEDAARYLAEKGIPCVVVTLGKKGALACLNNKITTAGIVEADVVDTTGAGDAFWGGFLHRFFDTGKRPDALLIEEVRDCLVFGNTTAALCVRRRGAIPAMPSLDEATALYNSIKESNQVLNPKGVNTVQS